jgi:ligand-binding SRPBCC domain-containing protein
MAPQPYQLVHEQLVPRKLEEVFEFFSRAENLETLTPDWLHFKIESVDPQPVQMGTRINYKLRVRGLPLRWTSEIREWNPPAQFVDFQTRGPYKLWHHTHKFIAEGDKTRIVDEVLYELPFGPLGRIAHAVMVKSDVQKIFLYRETKIRELFGLSRVPQ